MPRGPHRVQFAVERVNLDIGGIPGRDIRDLHRSELSLEFETDQIPIERNLIFDLFE